MFAAWGRFVHRHRWVVLIGSGLVLAISIYLMVQGGNLDVSGNPTTESMDSVRADHLIKRELPSQEQQSFQLIFRSDSLNVQDPIFKSQLEAALGVLEADSRVDQVSTPFNVSDPTLAGAMISRDGHAVMVKVDLKDGQDKARAYYPELRAEVHPGPLHVTATGPAAIQNAFDETSHKDLARAELFSTPVALVLLILIFGAIVAALLPIGIGGLAIIGGLATTLALSHFTDVSIYATNVVQLIGLGLAIDYSLFLVNRFREELAKGAGREQALVRTMTTTGRAVTFSGVTVAIGLTGMLFYQGTFLASMGAAGALVAVIAIFYGSTTLPALLAILGPRINSLRLPFAGRGRERGFWHATATWVMQRPVLVLLPTLALLVLAGLPFAQMRIANSWVTSLPAWVEARQGTETLLHDFPSQDQSSFPIVVEYPDGDPLSAERVGNLYDLSHRVAAIPGVLRVDSVVDLDPKLGRADYQTLYSQSRENLPAPARQAVEASVGRHMVVLTARSGWTWNSDQARDLLKKIRAERVGEGGSALVTGPTAFNVDNINSLVSTTPKALGFVLVATYLLLFLLTGSLVVPLKAVMTNLLSLSASFGALVWIFQQGHLSSQLGFTPQPLDPSVPVILFSIVFGVSMDYEVLMVSRIQEEYRRTGDNTRAVAMGLERTGLLVTGAAAIMIAVFIGFALSEVVIIKAIGTGLAMAVFIDATLVRALIVPAAMRLMGNLNWWAPEPLAWLHRTLNLGEAEAAEAA